MSLSAARFGVVASPHPSATEAGITILKDGGNAIDAAVAGAFATGVVEPERSGIAGFGGSIIAYVARLKRVISVDCNSTAPAAARADMFETVPSSDGRSYTVPDGKHAIGPLSVGVPGVPAGLALLLRNHGTIDLSEALQPSIALAQDGFEVSSNLARGILASRAAIRRFPATRDVAMPNGLIPQPGDILRSPDLAGTLRQIAAGGIDEFYKGSIAKRISEYLGSVGGILSAEDLANYQAAETQPLQIPYRGYLVSTPPLTSGGITTLQMLKVIEDFPVSKHAWGSAEYYHLLIETMKASWTRRLLTYGDPRYVKVDQAAELEDPLIQSLRTEVRTGLEKPSLGELISPEPLNCTSDLCVADSLGNWVSITQTAGSTYGSMVTVPGTGLTLGHGVARFDPRPGFPNSIAPGKKPLINMVPLIVEKDGVPVAALGAVGGRTIVNNMLLHITGIVDYKLTPAQILRTPRCNVESREPVQLEWTLDESEFVKLRQLGHKTSKSNWALGSEAHIITGDGHGNFLAATDPRDEGLVTYA